MTRLKKLNKYNPMSILFLLLKNRKKILKEEQDETFKKICSRQMPLFKEAYQSLSDVLVVQEEKEYLALQELLFEIGTMIEGNRIPLIPILFDSPLAIKLTTVFRKYTSYFKKEVRDMAATGDDLFMFPGLHNTL